MKNITDEYGQVSYYTTNGNKPRFSQIDTPFYGYVSLGNMTAYKIFYHKDLIGRSYVGIEGRGFFQFDKGWKHFGYVKEKLNLQYDSDAMAVADFINAQIGEIKIDGDIQGEPRDIYIVKIKSDVSDEM